MSKMNHFDSVSMVCGMKGAEPAQENTVSAADLLQRAICAVLLDRENDEAVSTRAASSTPDLTGRLNIDLVNCTRRAAVAELNDRTGAEEAAAGLALLESAESVDTSNFQVVESALALSRLGGERELINHWYDIGLSLREAAKNHWTFELLLMASAGEYDDEDLEIFAHAVARITDYILWSAPFISAAPTLCALAALARERRKTLKGLMTGRLRKLDETVFGAGATPRLNFAEPQFSYARGKEGQGVLGIEVEVSGEGELHPGAYLLDTITYGLTGSIQAAFEAVERMKGKKRTEHRGIIDDALYKNGGRCEVVLRLDDGVSLSEKHLLSLQRRFKLGWEVAQHQIENLTSQPSLEVSE
jgi:hypothetical protein